jgi:peptide/nickel transport system substrate-binding protein
MKKFYKVNNCQFMEKVKNAILSFSKTEWKIFWVFLFLLFVSTILLLGQLNASLMTTMPKKGGDFSEGIIGSPRFVNPVLATTSVDKDLTSLVYSGLMRKNEEGKLVLDLAENLEISEDGLEYTFTLKDKIYFHNNEKVTVDDIIFTLEQVKDPNTNGPWKGNWSGVGIEKIDEKTIKFSLKKAYAPFLENTTLGILPKSLWENQAIELNPANEKAVGSGPYKVKKINKKSSGVVESYELTSFSKFSLGTPYIKNITFKFYTNEEDLIKALRGGSVDQISSISYENTSVLAEKDYSIKTGTLPRIFALFFNQNSNKIFTEKNIIEAINLAVDKNKIVEEVLYGYGKSIDELVLPNLISYEKIESDQKSSQEESVNKAEEILDREGWAKNDDGILEKKITENGKRKTINLNFSLSTSNTPELMEIAEMIKKDLENIGMIVEIKTFEVGNLSQMVIRPRKYDALLFGQIIKDEADLYAFWHSSQRNDPGLNIAMYTNSKVDKILEDILGTLDKEERENKYMQFGEELRKDTPVVFLYSPNFIYVLSKDIKGFNIGNIIDSQERFTNVYKWYINEEKVWKIFAS